MKWNILKKEFSSEISMTKKILKKLWLYGIIIAILSYPISGFYLVGTNETGVLKRFGKIIDDRVPSGLHYRFPWPIDKVIRLSTREINRFQCGFGVDPDVEKQYQAEQGSFYNIQLGTFAIPYCITGDKNILHIKIVGQYNILNPRDFMTNFVSPDQFLVFCVQSCIIDAVGNTDVDTVLTTGRVELQRKILVNVQEEMEKYGSGISVISIEIKNIRPPSPVAYAFKDVVNAREERGTMIHDAEAYRNQIIPEAKAEASKILNEAEAFKTRRTQYAQGEAERFKLFAAEYSKAKKITEDRIYIQTMADIMSRVKKFIIDEHDQNKAADLKFFIKEFDKNKNEY
ncbi:MAG: HflK protein [Candidatus Schekmanbacteria bacterium RBG_13_48_7]|uniref:Protein HflK n=1 Tax=Candidatus Schekmanbacteria bacterium RBG_13_48_7 TaxID=1817878 RepID=A0A1F7S0E4_9BACT|nr:MAG: HflK protein [Candidatus Schekmanbacteria bacterium RBG_13_48_7]